MRLTSCPAIPAMVLGTKASLGNFGWVRRWHLLDLESHTWDPAFGEVCPSTWVLWEAGFPDETCALQVVSWPQPEMVLPHPSTLGVALRTAAGFHVT